MNKQLGLLVVCAVALTVLPACGDKKKVKETSSEVTTTVTRETANDGATRDAKEVIEHEATTEQAA